jgi:hypothetical protein
MTTTRQPDGQVHAFRVKPNPQRTLYLTVRVFDTLKSMYRHVGNTGGTRTGDYFAIARPHVRRLYTRTGYARTRPDIGELCFTVKGMTAEIIAHEATHIALAYIRRTWRHADFTVETTGLGASVQARTAEEWFCLAVGKIVNQIVIHWRAYEQRRDESSQRARATRGRMPGVRVRTVARRRARLRRARK